MVSDSPPRAMRPAPHVRADGTVTRPVLTLERMLERVHEPDPQPWGWQQRQRFLATLRECQQFRRDVREILGLDTEEEDRDR